MTYHENLMHTTDKTSLPCDMCKKTFASHTTLKSHKKYAHSKERNEECTYCSEKFKQKRDLRLHLASIHDVDKSREKYGESWEKEVLKCEHSESTFSYKKNLNAHIITKHSARVERFKCEECQSDFLYKQTLDTAGCSTKFSLQNQN